MSLAEKLKDLGILKEVKEVLDKEYNKLMKCDIEVHADNGGNCQVKMEGHRIALQAAFQTIILSMLREGVVDTRELFELTIDAAERAKEQEE